MLLFLFRYHNEMHKAVLDYEEDKRREREYRRAVRETFASGGSIRIPVRREGALVVVKGREYVIGPLGEYRRTTPKKNRHAK